MNRIRSAEALEAALRLERALLYKHSPICGLSYRARTQVRNFAENFPDAPVFHIDVIADRAVSNEVALRLGIRHESPQVILVERGAAVADASHHDVRAETLDGWWTRGLVGD